MGVAHNKEESCKFIEANFEYELKNATMAAKSSESENNVFVMIVTDSLKVLPNQEKAWKCGRGEVAW
jgi:hypothetical protein